MSTEVHALIEAVRALDPVKRREFALALEKEALVSPGPSRAALVRAIQGKYSHVPTSSDEFLRRKREDNEAEGFE